MNISLKRNSTPNARVADHKTSPRSKKDFSASQAVKDSVRQKVLRKSKSELFTGDTWKFSSLSFNVVDKLATELELRGLHYEGIFRISGSQERVDALLEMVGSQDLQVQPEMDVHDISSALKTYLREQPESLVPSTLHKKVLDAWEGTEGEDVAIRIKVIKVLLESLPRERACILRRIIVLLVAILDNAETTKMTADNLSIIFGPIFIRYEVEDLHNALASCSLGNNFAKLLIAYAPEFIVRPECVVPFEPSLSRMYQESLPERSSSLRLFGDISSMSPKDWQIITANSYSLSFGEDDVILGNHPACSSLYRIASGTVELLSNGRRCGQLHTNDLFGIEHVLGLRVQNLEYVAASPRVEVVELSASYVEQILSTDSALLTRFFGSLAMTLALKLKSLPFTFPSSDRVPRAMTYRSGVMKVYLSDADTKHVSFDRGSTFADIMPSVAGSDSSPRNFYAVSSNMAPTRLKMGDLLSNHSGKDSTYRIYFTETQPSPMLNAPVKQSVDLSSPIKEYQCKHKRVGTLYLTETHMAFVTKTLGFEKKMHFAYDEITSVLARDKLLMITTDGKEKAFKFNSRKDAESSANMASALWKRGRQTSATKPVSVIRSFSHGSDLDPTESEWDAILAGGNEKLFRDGETVIFEGSTLQRIYQIISGQCSVYVDSKHVAYMNTGTIFGELSFLLGGNATATVTAHCPHTDDTIVFVLEAAYLKRIFKENFRLEGCKDTVTPDEDTDTVGSMSETVGTTE